MQLQTILNRVERHKSFVYKQVRFDEEARYLTLRVEIEPRANGRPICSGCRQPRPGYDRLPARSFDFVPLWGIRVLFIYAMRRVSCEDCGVVTEAVPWGDGNCRQTTSYRWFLSRWARRLSWEEVANIFGTSWDTVYRAVQYAVQWGFVHRDERGVTAIGIDEIAWQKGHKYLTLVYQIDQGMKRLLWVGTERTEKTLHQFFDALGYWIIPSLKFVCSDMWQPYVVTIRERAGEAVHVLDRYHIMAKMNRAIDEVRAAEAKQLQRDGYEPILKHSRWCLLKRPENMTAKQTVKMSELLKYNLKSVRAYLHREDFQRFWEYRSPEWARKFLREWCKRTMRSKLEPMKKIARSLREHEELLLNWFRAKGDISAGIVEGFNNKAKLTMRKSYGFRSADVIKTALYHNLGALPEPKVTHNFC
ncbi:MAG: ISL3 family transposase [Pirellulaceae bacterium]